MILPCVLFPWPLDMSGRRALSPTVYLTLIHTKFHTIFNRPVDFDCFLRALFGDGIGSALATPP